MIFKVKWGDIEKEFGKRTNAITSEMPPVKAYFETELRLLMFIRLREQLFYAEIPTDSIQDINAFKMEYLADAFELLNNPLNTAIVIQQSLG